MDGSSIAQEALKEYEDTRQRWQDLRDYNRGVSPCRRSGHLRNCPTAIDPLLPCLAEKPRPIGKRRGIREVCKGRFDHNEECCPGQDECIREQVEWADDVGKPGVEAFERLPELLRRPTDVNSKPLSKWMRRAGLLHDVRYVRNPLGLHSCSLTGVGC